MEKFIYKLFCVFLLFHLCACNGPLDKTYSSATYLKDISTIRESNNVSYDDIELLTKYITLSKIAGNNLEGRTYKDILEKIKEIRKTNADQSDQIKMEKDARREQLGRWIKVALSDKKFSKVNNKDCLIYTVTINNLSSKNINMVVGNLSLDDLLEKEIKNLQIIVDEKIGAKATLKKTYTVAYDHSNENDKRIRAKDLVDLIILWNPEKIIFEDGTVAE